MGGFVILWVESKVSRGHVVTRVHEVDEISAFDALKLGFIQALSLIPGASRSGATIIGGLWLGWSRVTAAQFSFFLAMPTILAATLYEVFTSRHLLSMSDIPLFLVGSISSFITAFFCVRWLIRFISRHDFRWFAWYRIGFGCLILLLTQFELVSWE